MEACKTTIARSDGSSYEIKVNSVASINTTKCVNCGECRTICPVDAISEKQRVICRLCPGCTDKPALLYDEMVALATKESCTTACPLGMSPQGYINLLAAGKEKEAFEHIWKYNPLPSICGRICHHPCEQVCKRGSLVDEPLAIRGVKRYLSDKFADYTPEEYPVIYQEKVAVVGAGPAGLMAAHTLAQLGYKVTIFDREPKAGGMMNVGIPQFRLPQGVTAADVSRLERAGIVFELGRSISKNQINQFKKEFDKIIIATGAPHSKELHIDGWRKEGVLTALHFMERANQFQQLYRHPGQAFDVTGKVVVIGGGNVAIDCARTALRLGAESVTAVCVESSSDVPCHSWEIEHAKDEGVVLIEGWAPKRFTGAFNDLSGVELNKVIDFKKSADGAIQFKTSESETQTLPADWVIVAIGQSPSSFWKEYESDPAIVFAGDVVSYLCSVIDAMTAGMKAARLVDEQLQGRSFKLAEAEHDLAAAPINEKYYPATRYMTVRPPTPIVDAGVRVSGFQEVETAFSKEIIDLEIKRCMQCGYSDVASDKCIGCGVCRMVCPKGDVITMITTDKGGCENV
ncbi:MAG: FAD-dependent oxidoreductase [Oscillospiraceae bacterium]|nr:FAD-dependent oxidoreductase [Oscillospiraceae bacterium]